MSVLTKIQSGRLFLDLPPEQTFDDWRAVGQRLCMSSRQLNWLIGDWLIAGSERYGPKARDEAVAIFRRDEERLGPIVETCRIFPPHKRHENLSFGHHAVLTAIAAPVLKSSDEQEKVEALRVADDLLERAEKEGWDKSRMRSEVALVRHAQGKLFNPPDDDPEDTAMRRIVQAWNQAPRAAREAFIELAAESDLGVIDL